jgi:hypothetical protein
MLMKSKVRVLLSIFIVFIALLMMLPGCATSKKDNYLRNKAKSDAQSHINTTQLGRNKYFYSTKYQKKLSHYKKR